MRVQGTDRHGGATIRRLVAELETRLIDLRRDIHAHPEISNLEHRTTARDRRRAGAGGPGGQGAADRHRGLLRRAARGLRLRRGPDRVPGRHRRPADHRRQGRAVRLAEPGRLPCLRARRAHRDPDRPRTGAGPAAGPGPAPPRRPADLPAGRGEQSGRRAGRHRRRGAAGPDGDLRPALRPADRRRPAGAQGRRDHLRGGPGRHHPDGGRRSHVPAAPDPGHHRRPR